MRGTHGSCAAGVSMAQMDEMRDVFNLFDTDSSGALDPKEIRTQMAALGFQADNLTIYQLISDLDSDGSQRLEFEELFGMMRDQLGMHRPEYNTRQNTSEIFDY